TPGEGSTFTMRIPTLVPRGQALQHAPDIARDSEIENPLTSTASSANTILLIDDDPSVHQLIRRILEKENFTVVSAIDGRRGIELARELVPRAVILDILMPRMDGWAVLIEIKADPRLADIPVIIASIVDHKNRGFALGATDYLTKPFERQRLLSILHRYKCDLKTCQVLILEDDPDTRELLRRLLEAAGCSTAEASNGREGLKAMKAQVPDIILLDLMMPEMDGFEFLQHLRKVSEWRNIPVIVTTAKEIDDEDRRRLSSRVKRILQKGR